MNPEQQLSALLAECLGGQSELCSRDYVLLRWVWMIGFTPIPIRFINLWYRGEILGKLLPGWKPGPRGVSLSLALTCTKTVNDDLLFLVRIVHRLVIQKQTESEHHEEMC